MREKGRTEERGKGGPEALSVLHVVRPAAGGMVSHLRLLMPRLEERGFEVSVVGPSSLSPPSIGITAIAFHSVEILPRSHPVNDLRAARETGRIARYADLIHAHGLRGAWIAALAARSVRKPFLFTAHNLAPQSGSPLARFCLRYVVRRASGIVCVSRAVAESLVPYGATESQITVIPNGIDLAPFDRDIEPHAALSALGISGSPVIVSVGRLSPEKGFATLVEAARAVVERFPEAQFVLAGDGPERESLRQQIDSLGLGPSIHLVGRVEDAAALLLAADVVAIPSLSEGQGIVALEAMAARKPVVVSCVGGLAETVEDGIEGILVPPGDGAALAAGLIRPLEEPDAWEAMGAAGRARVESQYTAERMAERTADLYRQIIAHSI